MHIIGRGRYARETYPSRSAQTGVVQMGYDQAIAQFTILPTTSAFFPRDGVGNPLRVILPGVRPGNTLEIDFRACLEKAEAYYYIINEVRTVAFVTFNGVAPVLTPSATVFAVQDSTSGHKESDVTPDSGDQPIFNMTALAAVVIPAGATIATVQIVLATAAGIIVDGSATQGDSRFATLKCSELSSLLMSQPGPGALVPTL